MPEHRNSARLSLWLRPILGSASEEADEKKFSDLIEAIADFSTEQSVFAYTDEQEGRAFVATAEYENALGFFRDLEARARDRATKDQEEQHGFIQEPDLVKELQEAGTVIARSSGNTMDLVLVPAPANYDFARLRRYLVEKADRTRKASVVIHVSSPRTGAYNPDRPISSLLKAQVEHCREAENRLPPRYRHEIDTYVNAIKTEREAARYIRAVTEAIHQAHEDAERERRAPRRKRVRVMEIAAVADERADRLRRKKKRKHSKR